MMKILRAHECPIEYFDENIKYTDYQYALYHLFEKNEQYYQHFKDCISKGIEVFLDNSAFEFKDTDNKFNEEQFVDYITKLNPFLYLVPDTFNDGYNTIMQFDNWINKYKDLKPLKMGIVHGQSYEEYLECYKYLSSHADYIGFCHSDNFYLFLGKGKTKEERQANGRIQLIKMLIQENVWNWNKPHHLLGMSAGFELKFYKNNNIYNIRSIDTSNPIIAGMQNIKYKGDLCLDFKPQGLMADHINDKLDDNQRELILYNINCFNFALNS